jgi:protein phosphatase 1 regulatory subunit 27
LLNVVLIYFAGLTPLHQAVLDGNESAVRLLVAHGADINKQDDDSWTPLHAACAEGYADIVKYVNIKDESSFCDLGIYSFICL